MFEYDIVVTAKIARTAKNRLRTPTLCIVNVMERPERPVEARVIDEAQKSAVPSLSMRKAAERAGISEGRWRQIIKGYQGTGTGRIPVVAPDETVARMALAVGVTAPQLADAGRHEAAEALRRLLAASERPDVELSEVSIDRLLGEIRRRVTGATNADNSAADDQTPTTEGATNTTSEGEKNLDGAKPRKLKRLPPRGGSAQSHD